MDLEWAQFRPWHRGRAVEVMTAEWLRWELIGGFRVLIDFKIANANGSKNTSRRSIRVTFTGTIYAEKWLHSTTTAQQTSDKSTTIP